MRQQLTLLASGITNREHLVDLMQQDRRDLFTYADTLAIYDALRDMISDGIDPDLATLAVRLRDTQGDRATEIISELSRAETTINFAGLLSEIMRHNDRSRMMDICKDAVQHIKDGGSTESAAAMILDLQDKLAGPAPDVSASMKDLASGDLDDLFAQHAALPTGIDAIDNYLPGLFPGQLVIIAARPGMGKTSLALQMAGNLPGVSLFFSLEMSRTEIFARRLSGMASVEGWKIETSKVNDDEARRVLDAQQAIKQAESDIIIIDRMSDVSGIINTMRRLIRRGNVSGVFVDYLQLMSGGRGETQNLRIADITRRLKLAAMENSTPIILMSQLNRSSEYQNREPVLSDLRDSGAIEQDADVVIFISESDDDGARLIFAKNRKGRTGKTPIDFDKRFTRFMEAS